ncbi:hypothetical protein NIES4103_12410 [Nostoc sp. NIES-4103]|nr:hypothetical protein NIES4103_12410 [Nostoc sp. NIES-4103]
MGNGEWGMGNGELGISYFSLTPSLPHSLIPRSPAPLLPRSPAPLLPCSPAPLAIFSDDAAANTNLNLHGLAKMNRQRGYHCHLNGDCRPGNLQSLSRLAREF